MKIDLPEVTLIAVSSIRIHETILALQRSYRDINFAEVKLITHEKPINLPSDIKYEQCNPINNILDYNNLVFSGLYPYVKTSHCLLIQYDGWVIHPQMWNKYWLQFDFIGAPWVWKEKDYLSVDGKEHIRVGNGGVSIRSHKLLSLPKQYNIPLVCDRGYWNEDGNICVYHRDRFLQLGIKFAPVEIAARFSHELDCPENYGIKTFAFHKYLGETNKNLRGI